jgi:hypothetical protein
MDAEQTQTPEQAALNKRRLNEAIEDLVSLLDCTFEGFYDEGVTGPFRTDAGGPHLFHRVWGQDLLSATEREFLQDLIQRLSLLRTKYA